MATKKQISLLGLGKMGVKLAELLVHNHHVETVWNRTMEKAKGLSGVITPEVLDQAIAASPIIIVCVYDYQAVKSILQKITTKNLLVGKTIINFTTCSPTEAEELQNWLQQQQAHYLSGALQVAPDQIGMPDTTILLSGDSAVYAASETILKIFGGNLKYLGQQAAAASAMDLATLSWLYGSYVGLLQGEALAQKFKLDLSQFKNILGEISPGFTQFFTHQVAVIQKQDFTVTQSPLAISIHATQRIYEAVHEAGLHVDFAAVIRNYLQTAAQRNLVDQELAALIKFIQLEPAITSNNSQTIARA